MKNNKKEAVVKKTAKAKAEKAEGVENENLPVPIVKRAEDMSALDIIESGIRRDLMLGTQLDKASAMVQIKVGIALNSAQQMLRHGEYGPWLETKFGAQFGAKKARNCARLSAAFEKEMLGRLELPAAKEAGNWLAVQNEGSQLFKSVSEFVGELSFTELLEKYHIRTPKDKGGWRPSEFMVNRFVMEHKELIGVPFSDWSDEQKDAFRDWADKNNDGDSAEAKAMAAEGSWGTIRRNLEEHGMGRASWKFLSPKSLQDTADVLKEVLADINKALKLLNK